MKKTTVFGLILIILLAGCIKNSKAVIEKMAFEETSAPVMITDTRQWPWEVEPTLRPTKTPVDITKLPAVHWVDLKPGTSDALDFQGQVILYDRLEGDYHLLNDSGEKELLSMDNAIEIQATIASPNKRWFAYITILNDETSYTPERMLVVESADRTEQYWHVWKPEWSNFSSWLDDDRILIQGEDMIFVLDTIQGQVLERIMVEFPFVFEENLLNWGAQIIPDSTLRYVIYPKYHDGMKIAVWDRSKNRPIIQETLRPSFGVGPVWSKNGDSVYITNGTKLDSIWHEDVFLINLNGSIEQITYFSEKNTISVFGHQFLSPSGRNLALIARIDPDLPTMDQEQIVIIDLETKQVSIYRIPEVNVSIGFIFWSLDETQLMIEHYSPAYFSRSQHITLVDLQSQQFFFVADKARLVGWIEPE
jgi:hypothetical protein